MAQRHTIRSQAFEAVAKKLIDKMRAPALNCVELSMNELCDITSQVAEKVGLGEIGELEKVGLGEMGELEKVGLGEMG